LQLNASKTEVLWFVSAANLRKIPSGKSVIRAGSSAIDPATVVRNLGVMIDAELSMRDRVSRVAQVCFFHLHRLRPMRARLGRDVTLTLVSDVQNTIFKIVFYFENTK